MTALRNYGVLVVFRVDKDKEGAHFVPNDPDPREHETLEPPAKYSTSAPICAYSHPNTH